MPVSSLRGHLPAPSLTFFITGATGSCPGGVPPPFFTWPRLSPRGRGCTAAPNGTEQSNHARTATSVAQCTSVTCPPGTHFTDSAVALQTEHPRGGVRQV